MSQLALITLTLAEADSGPFDLYCVSPTGVVTGPFQSNIPKSLLLAGYVVNNLPVGCQKVRVQSNSVLCKNYIDLSLPITTTTTTTVRPVTTTTTVRPATTTTTTVILVPTTTTTTSNITTTTSTSTTSTSTTSTTTAAPGCIQYYASAPNLRGDWTLGWIDCNGVIHNLSGSGSGSPLPLSFCAFVGNYIVTGNCEVLTLGDPCGTPTTTTTAPPTTTSTTIFDIGRPFTLDNGGVNEFTFQYILRGGGLSPITTIPKNGSFIGCMSCSSNSIIEIGLPGDNGPLDSPPNISEICGCVSEPE